MKRTSEYDRTDLPLEDKKADDSRLVHRLWGAAGIMGALGCLGVVVFLVIVAFVLLRYVALFDAMGGL